MERKRALGDKTEDCETFRELRSGVWECSCIIDRWTGLFFEYIRIYGFAI